MGTTYKVNITEYPGDVATLKGYFLQVAKSVAGANGSSPTYTVVYSAHESAPNTGVQWQETYGLNWMTEVPNPGATVTCTGQWQQCALGTSYDLTADGEWSLDTSDPNAQANAVNVGKNNYVDSSGNLIPVNIVVGVQGQSTNEWNPVSALLVPRASATAKTFTDLGGHPAADRRCKWAVHTSAVCRAILQLKLSIFLDDIKTGDRSQGIRHEYVESPLLLVRCCNSDVV